MAVATRSKGYPDVTSTENWKYTTTNNIKNFRNKDEAQRFIAGTVKIWKLESFKNGHLFIDNLLKSVENLERSTTTGFEYLDDNGDVCYILFLIQLMSDGKSIQITHTQHKLSRTGARRSGSDSVQVEESNAGRWLMQRAYEELRLPYDAINSNANHKNISTEYQIKINGEEHDLSTEQIAKLVSMHPTSPYNDEMHYHIMHRQRHSKAYLKGIPAIADFCLHLSHPEECLESLSNWCKKLQQPKELCYTAQRSNSENVMLNIAAVPENDLIHLHAAIRVGTMKLWK